MDRDMVNCLHYLYQWGQIPKSQLDGIDPGDPLFWCDPDTRQPLTGRKIVKEDSEGLKLAPEVLELLDMIESQLRTLPRPDYAFGYPLSSAIRPPGSNRPAFLAIPYAPEFDPVKRSVIDAANNAGFECEVTGDLSAPGDIMDQVWQGVRGADVVVADISHGNPNVFYEIGIAHALGKEVILISQDDGAPFDIRSSRRLTYDPRDLATLEAKLEAAFRSVSARYPHEGDEPRF